MKTDIRNLEDIILFVNEFYGKVQQDELIGPVFAKTVKDWPVHLERMHNFWNAALFGVAGFKGNPFARHAPLPIEQKHFDRWLVLFNETIDTQFEGPMATETKNKAELMSVIFVTRLQNMTGGADKVIV